MGRRGSILSSRRAGKESGPAALYAPTSLHQHTSSTRTEDLAYYKSQAETHSSLFISVEHVLSGFEHTMFGKPETSLK